MALPEVTETIRDGALGIVADNGANVQAKIGVCSLGTPDTVYGFSTLASLVAALGVGPLVEAAALTLAVAGGPVFCVPVTPSSSGAAGSVTHTGTGTCTLAVTGTPNDAYSVVVNIIQGAGTLSAGTATCQISLDGGNNFGPVTAIPSGGVLTPAGTGLTLTFTYASGTAFVAGDSYDFTCTAGSFGVTEVTGALTALLADPQEWFAIHVVGPGTASAAATLFSGLDTLMSSAAATSFRYARAFIEAEDTDANLKTSFASLASTDGRVVVCAGTETVVSPINGRLLTRSSAWSATARAQKVAPSTDLGRVADGPLEGVRALGRDEFATPALDAARFLTLRTIIGRQGFYVTNPRTMASTGSDYTYLQNGRVMDIACTVARDAALEYLNSSLRINSDGTINNRDASTIEDAILSALHDALTIPGYASAVSCTVDRTTDLLSTGQLNVTVRVTPLGYAKSINLDLGFTNPALSLAAA